MYDYVFITHLPSFYKVNLYNSIAKKAKIFVIFISSGSKERTNDFIKKEILFDYKIISSGNYESRFKLFSLFSIYFLLRKLKYKKIVVSGWELIEFWLIVFINKKENNCLCLESTILGTNMNLPYYLLKRFFISNISIIFASGSLHSKIPKKLEHKGKTFITNGVGIIEKYDFIKCNKDFEFKFLFVGRLVSEKNLLMLIEVFSKTPKFQLTIVGSGPMKKTLNEKASNNIKFIEHIHNHSIHKIYLEHDIFILPSLKEAWGIVIDEALYYGLPILVSSNVGCYPELVENIKSGFIFNPNSKEDLLKYLNLICDSNIYNELKENIHNFNLDLKDKQQTQTYLDVLNT